MQIKMFFFFNLSSQLSKGCLASVHSHSLTKGFFINLQHKLHFFLVSVKKKVLRMQGFAERWTQHLVVSFQFLGSFSASITLTGVVCKAKPTGSVNSSRPDILTSASRPDEP